MTLLLRRASTLLCPAARLQNPTPHRERQSPDWRLRLLPLHPHTLPLHQRPQPPTKLWPKFATSCGVTSVSCAAAKNSPPPSTSSPKCSCPFPPTVAAATTNSSTCTPSPPSWPAPPSPAKKAVAATIAPTS